MMVPRAAARSTTVSNGTVDASPSGVRAQPVTVASVVRLTQFDEGVERCECDAADRSDPRTRHRRCAPTRSGYEATSSGINTPLTSIHPLTIRRGAHTASRRNSPSGASHPQRRRHRQGHDSNPGRTGCHERPGGDLDEEFETSWNAAVTRRHDQARATLSDETGARCAATAIFNRASPEARRRSSTTGPPHGWRRMPRSMRWSPATAASMPDGSATRMDPSPPPRRSGVHGAGDHLQPVSPTRSTHHDQLHQLGRTSGRLPRTVRVRFRER